MPTRSSRRTCRSGGRGWRRFSRFQRRFGQRLSRVTRRSETSIGVFPVWPRQHVGIIGRDRRRSIILQTRPSTIPWLSFDCRESETTFTHSQRTPPNWFDATRRLRVKRSTPPTSPSTPSSVSVIRRWESTVDAATTSMILQKKQLEAGLRDASRSDVRERAGRGMRTRCSLMSRGFVLDRRMSEQGLGGDVQRWTTMSCTTFNCSIPKHLVRTRSATSPNQRYARRCGDLFRDCRAHRNSSPRNCYRRPQIGKIAKARSDASVRTSCTISSSIISFAGGCARRKIAILGIATLVRRTALLDPPSRKRSTCSWQSDSSEPNTKRNCVPEDEGGLGCRYRLA